MMFTSPCTPELDLSARNITRYNPIHCRGLAIFYFTLGITSIKQMARDAQSAKKFYLANFFC